MATRSSVRNLLGILAARHPDLIAGEDFLDRLLIAEGLCFSAPPLRSLFGPFGAIEAGVLVRGGSTGERVGLVLFSDSGGCSAAAGAPPLPGCYRNLIRGSCASFLDGCFMAQSLRQLHLRLPITELLASLVPSSFFDPRDEDGELRFCCVFLKMTVECLRVGGRETSIKDDGALFPYYIARDMLAVAGDVRAVVLCQRHGVAAVILYHSVDAEGVAGASMSLLRTGVGVYDSSSLPIGPVDGGGALLRLLPAFCHSAAYRGRVVILRGLDTAGRHRDAGTIAESIQLFMWRFHRLEAVVVHREDAMVVAVLGSREEALALADEPEESWVQVFGQAISCMLMDAEQFPTDLSASAPEFIPRAGVFAEAMEIVERRLESYLRGRVAAQDTRGAVLGLIARVAVTRPHVIRATGFGGFADRALVLLGVSRNITASRLRSVLFPIGGVEACILLHELGIALVVFTAASVAARVVGEPTERWVATGFSECLPAPGAEEASKVADTVLGWRLQALDWVYLGRRWADEQWQRDLCVRILELIDVDTSDLI